MPELKFFIRTVGGRYSKTLAFSLGLIIYTWYFTKRVNQSDFLVLYSAAAAVTHHVSPYPAFGSPSVYSGSSFVYPYISAYLFVPFTWLSPVRAEYAFVVISLVSICASLWMLGVRRVGEFALFLAASTTIVAWQMGTLNPLFIVGIAAAWRFRSKAFVVGVLVSMVAFVKLFLVPLLLWLVIARRFRALAYGVGILALLAAASFLGGPLSLFRFVALLGQLSHHEGARGFSTSFLLRSLGVGEGFSELVVLATAAILALFLYLRYGATKSERFLLAGCIGASLIVTPILWSSYLLLVAVICLLIFPSEIAAVVYALLSWAIVTPDRAGILVNGILVTVVLIGSATLLRSSIAQTALKLGVRGNLVRLAAAPRLVIIAAVPIVVLGATALIDFRIQPAIVVQLSLLYCLPVSMLLLSRHSSYEVRQGE